MRPDDAERLWFASVDAGLSEDDELSGVDVAEGAGKKAVKTGNAVVTGLAVEAFVVVKAGCFWLRQEPKESRCRACVCLCVRVSVCASLYAQEAS